MKGLCRAFHLGVLTLTFSGATFCRGAETPNAWIELMTPHFRLFTTNTRASALHTLDLLEQAHDFLTSQPLFRPAADLSVTVIAFGSPSEYAAYQPHPGVCAFYQRSRLGDFIVLRNLKPDAYVSGVHEYTHFLVAHSDLKLPLWLKEGLADFYSSLDFTGREVLVGRAPAGRLDSFRGRAALLLEELFRTDRESSRYNSLQEAYLFYGQSWAMAHMLALSPVYSPQLAKFLHEISAGLSESECFRVVYGKSLDQVSADLAEHVQNVTAARLPWDISSETKPEAQSALVSIEQAQTMLAELLAANPARQAEAERRLSELAAEFPDNPQPEDSLAYIALRRGDTTEAKMHFARAIKRATSRSGASYTAVSETLHSEAGYARFTATTIPVGKESGTISNR